jgi:transcriptional regulator GlxA family with amidase domain
MAETTTVDLLVLPDINLILLASVIEPMRGANRISGRQLYRWRILSPDGKPVVTTSGIPVPVDGAFPLSEESAPLFVLSAYYWQRHATAQVKMMLSRSARTRPYIAGIESGTWLMAEASLLDGYSATVHWEDFDDFASAYPQISAVRGRYVVDGKRVTAGGALPTLDLMLELIRRRHGYSLALEVSRLFIYEPGGTVAAAPSLPLAPSQQITDERVVAAIRMMEAHIEQPLAVSRIARRVGVSARHLQSLFKEQIGVLPHIHYLALRLNAARRKAVETRQAFTEIAVACGFNSVSAFSRSYRAHFGESPSGTRKRLRQARSPADLG